MGIFDGLNKEQEMAVRDTDGVMLILAGAGSGKTRVLTCRVANLVCRGVDPCDYVYKQGGKRNEGTYVESGWP